MEKQGKTSTRRDLWLGVGGFVALILLSFGFLMIMNPSNAGLLHSGPLTWLGGKTADITLIHTNDTWGYVDPCG
jgi:hypothetical protein